MEKNNLHWLVTILISLIIGAYAWIFMSVIDRIDKIEVKVDQLNPIFVQIQADIAVIRTNQEWIMRKLQ